VNKVPKKVQSFQLLVLKLPNRTGTSIFPFLHLQQFSGNGFQSRMLR